MAQPRWSTFYLNAYTFKDPSALKRLSELESSAPAVLAARTRTDDHPLIEQQFYPRND